MALSVPATEDDARLGILLMLGAWFLFSLVDTSAKWLALVGLPAMQLAFFRYAGHLVIALGLSIRDGLGAEALPKGKAWLLLSRAFLLVTATLSNFYALNFLPLTVTSAIMFSTPVIVCFLSVAWLREQVGPWRWFAILLGFVGVLIVIQPFGEAFHPAMLLCIYNAVALALYSILTRQLAGIVSTETMQLYMGVIGTVAMTPLAFWVWQTPAGILDWALLIGLGVFGWAGHQLLTTAHRFATANTLMPFTYSFLIYLTILSWLFFAHVPGLWTLFGALIIMASGLIIWKREQSA
ncbi:MAG: DMT family transporter [Pseudomonadota bacterium]